MWRTHRITVETQVPLSGTKEKAALVRRVIRATLQAEGVEIPCEVNVLFVDDAQMQEINFEQRGIEKNTDVLSFPMLELAPGRPPRDRSLADPGTGLTPLGDMVLSREKIREQAAEYGHSEQRELSYLVVHSVLHLLGYDHMDEGAEKAQMRQREEAVLRELGLVRAEETAK